MTLDIAQSIVATFEAYAVAGVGFALLFLPRAIAGSIRGSRGRRGR